MMRQTYINKIDIALNGFEGFQIAQTKQYDFIVCDLDMPILDGYQCAQRIKL